MVSPDKRIASERNAQVTGVRVPFLVLNITVHMQCMKLSGTFFTSPLAPLHSHWGFWYSWVVYPLFSELQYYTKCQYTHKVQLKQTFNISMEQKAKLLRDTQKSSQFDLIVFSFYFVPSSQSVWSIKSLNICVIVLISIVMCTVLARF